MLYLCDKNSIINIIIEINTINTIFTMVNYTYDIKVQIMYICNINYICNKYNTYNIIKYNKYEDCNIIKCA